MFNKVKPGDTYTPAMFAGGLEDAIRRLVMLDGVLTHKEGRALSVLVGLAGNDGFVWRQSKATIADMVGISTRRLADILAGLEKKGFIRIERPTTAERRIYHRVDRYYFTWLPELAGHLDP